MASGGTILTPVTSCAEAIDAESKKSNWNILKAFILPPNPKVWNA